MENSTRRDRDTENTLMVIMPPALKGRLKIAAARLSNLGDDRGSMSEIVRSLLENALPKMEREIEKAEEKARAKAEKAEAERDAVAA